MARSKPDPSENPSPAPTPPVPDAAAAPADETLASARREAAENYDRYVRAVADLENFRRRAARDKDELLRYANGRLIEELLPVLDNLVLGLSAARQPGADLQALTGGVDLVLTQLKTALSAHGLVEINPAGEKFDPHRHEAISHQTDARIPEEHVIHVVRPGFLLNGRLLRPASVVVSSGPAAPANS